MENSNTKKPGVIASFKSLKRWAEDEKSIRINAGAADVIRQYPMKVNEYYRSLIETEGDRPPWIHFFCFIALFVVSLTRGKPLYYTTPISEQTRRIDVRKRGNPPLPIQP